MAPLGTGRLPSTAHPSYHCSVGLRCSLSYVLGSSGPGARFWKTSALPVPEQKPLCLSSKQELEWRALYHLLLEVRKLPLCTWEPGPPLCASSFPAPGEGRCPAVPSAP